MTTDDFGIGRCVDGMHTCANSHAFALAPASVDDHHVGLVVTELNSLVEQNGKSKIVGPI